MKAAQEKPERPIQVTPESHARVKALAYWEGRTMKDVVDELTEKAVQSSKRIPIDQKKQLLAVA